MSDAGSEFVTNLDSMEFDDLVLLARAEIPRYAADWTDHNLHDPGMTMIDLLAWIVDQQIFRVGSVGSRHRRAFAALLGQKPEGAQPARGVVWPSEGLSEGRVVQQGAPVVCVTRPTLPFALERQLFLTAAVLRGAHVTVDGRHVPASDSDFDAVSWTLGGHRHQSLTALTLQFSGALGTSEGEAPMSLGFDVVPHPGPAITSEEPAWGPVRFEYRDSGTEEWTDLPVEFDSTAGLATSGFVVVRAPEAPAGTARAELRLRMDDGFFPIPPHIRAVTINALPVVQLEQVPPASFPQPGTGQPDQILELVTDDLVPPLSRPDGPLLEIKVDGERWLRVDDFDKSRPDNLHFVVNEDRLVFGNGLNGRCPRLRAEIEHSELARTSCAAGNLRAGLTWRLPALEGVAGDFGANRHAFADGRGVSTASELVAKARAAATRRKAMVTNDDVTRVAQGLPGMAVGRAEVLSRFDPRMPVGSVDGVRTLIVVPHGFPTGAGSVPQTYIDEVARRLGHRRLVGERLVVQGPAIVRVSVQIEVTTEPWADAPTVTAAIEAAVRKRLTATRIDDDVEPWPLGRDLTVSDILSLSANVNGVATVGSVRISEVGADLGKHPVAVPRDGVVVVGAEDLLVDAMSGTTVGSSVPGFGRSD
ncbi:baseplate J/gp47 family protein [Arthrobacter sp. Z4-13]